MSRRIGKFFVVVGVFWLLAGAGFVAKNLLEQKNAGEVSKSVLSDLNMEEMVELAKEWDEEFEIPEHELRPNMEMPEVEIDGIAYIGALRISALDVELPVISETTYPYLRKAPCRLQGSVYLDDLVIGAHNYATHFGRIAELSYGDRMTFTDMDGNLFVYEVADIEIVEPDQVEYVCSGEWPLSLFTCTVGGRKRVVVRCEKVKR